MNTQSNINIDAIADSIVQQMKENLFIMVEASGRHVHLSREHVEQLFGTGYQLHRTKDLSQPGQYACEERVNLTGPKGTLNNVVVLGPERKSTQAEISLTDGLALGIKPPVRLSGDVFNTPGVTVTNPKNGASISISEGLIVAKRHIHITPEDAQKFHVQNGEHVKVKVFGSRPVIFEDVDIRVSKDFRTAMHIDYDEANACGFGGNIKGMIIVDES